MFYYLVNQDGLVWSGYKFKKGTWQKAMLYKRKQSVIEKRTELMIRGYSCTVKAITIQEVDVNV